MDFLRIISSTDPGVHAFQTTGGAFIGMLDGLLNGVVAGLLFAWLYKRFAGLPQRT
ncbi:MAG: hypothetical protein WA416_16190 [Candidatus Sulfotelmatobacter sp.]